MFRFRFRVRYGECDAQGIVFNARWGDYIDLAATEYTRALFGGTDAATAGMDWRLVKQTKEWKAPARFDDVLEAHVRTIAVGTTSFTVGIAFHRDDTLLATTETIYVCVDADGVKRPIPARNRAALEAGSDLLINHAGG